MTNHWQPGTQYGYGDVVSYQGHNYKIIQPHLAQGDWAPSNTPALWGRQDDGDYGNQQQGSYQQGGYQQPQQGYQQPPQYNNNEKPSDRPTEEERKKNWYDLDDDRKKQLEIGGGILAGLGALGVGVAAYKHHEKSKEEEKALNWSLSNWAQDAENRRRDYHQRGPTGPATWILNSGKDMPRDAIRVMRSGDADIYICRAFYEGGIQIGKASSVFKKGGVIGFAHDEIHLDTYEILVGDMRGLKWVNTSGNLNLASLNARPVEGGREADGKPLYVAKAPYNNGEHPGKAREGLDGMLTVLIYWGNAKSSQQVA
ncbi:carbohydrate-binding module family 12 protein [Cylindrobasidium torrendii FP15055 ss-10]|uniref:Carbohydrate-binding module family 12 protein n=1 Tax=Cylindrobasidium torrendii FP15055 ss-10 TaxID=1314674 RepID=A0A0D7B5B6_9AGAR|nr:carbohydrate-binding module family 12 protein [Cylindrobasidium torrendii FP15055 ss-10]